VKEGYIIEFFVEYSDSFSKADFFFLRSSEKATRRNLVVDQDVVCGERIDACGAR